MTPSQEAREAAEAYWAGWSNNVPQLPDESYHPLVLMLTAFQSTITARVRAETLEENGNLRDIGDILADELSVLSHTSGISSRAKKALIAWDALSFNSAPPSAHLESSHDRASTLSRTHDCRRA